MEGTGQHQSCYTCKLVQAGKRKQTLKQQRIHVALNAKSTNAATDLDAALDLLGSQGADVTLDRIEDPASLPEHVARAAGSADVIVIGGGDGTMASAGGALVGAGLPVGILPLGNSCDLARSLAIPRDPVEACRLVLEGSQHAIDIASVNGHSYFNMASMGLSVSVAERLTRDAKKRWGVLNYPKLLWDAVQATRSFHAEIDCDGDRQRVHAIQVGVGNGKFYGAGMTVVHDSRIDDGLLHVHVIPPMSRLKLLLLFPFVRWGYFDKAEPVVVMKGRRITVATSRPRSVNADGEIVTRTPATFEVRAGAINVFVPADKPIPALEANHADG